MGKSEKVDAGGAGISKTFDPRVNGRTGRGMFGSMLHYEGPLTQISRGRARWRILRVIGGVSRKSGRSDRPGDSRPSGVRLAALTTVAAPQS